MYVKGNPINLVDPTGFVACSLNFRFCKIINGQYEGFFMDIHHWNDSRLMSQDINDKLNDLKGKYLGQFVMNTTLARYVPFNRTYYTNLPVEISTPTLDSITLGIVMDFNIGIEGFEGIDPACWGGDGVLFGHRCSSFSNEDLPSAYLGFVAYINNWNLKDTLRKLVVNVDEDTEGTNQFPSNIVERLFDAQNHCFTPKNLDSSTGSFANYTWPSEILYDAIGPGRYWATSQSALVPPIQTPPISGSTPTP
jgi:hypothetical protein